jgi:hypothetical protein
MQVLTRPLGPVAGIAVALPTGSAGDPVGAEGATWIVADAVVREVAHVVGEERVEGAARVEPDRTTLTFIARFEALPELFAALPEALYGAGPASPRIEAALADRSDDLAFQQDSPVLEVNRATRALVYGSAEARVHAPGGTLASVESLTPAALDRVRRTAFETGRAVLVVVGPVAAPPEATPPPAGAAAGTGSVAAPRPAWSEGRRQVVEREVTSSWVTVAWPVPAGLPRVAVDFLAHRMERELNPSPPDPGVFSATVDVVQLPDGEALLARAAVEPRQADAMEQRILTLATTLSTPLDPSFFSWYRRQFRADRLMADAPPEVAARRRAREILARGAALEVGAAVWALTPEIVAEAARALGPPRILVFGPPHDGN